MKIVRIIILLIIYNPLFCQETFPVNGVASTFSPIYAFKNAHIIISPEKEILSGTLLIQDDKILEADSIVEIPKGSIVKDLNGDYIYPSFIDLYSNYGIKEVSNREYNYRPQYKSKKDGAFHWNEAIHPEINASEKFIVNSIQSQTYLSSGFGIVFINCFINLMRFETNI